MKKGFKFSLFAIFICLVLLFSSASVLAEDAGIQCGGGGCGESSCDQDGDGYSPGNLGWYMAWYCDWSGYEPGDCDDEDGYTYPGAPEQCGNDEDDDCDGQVDENCAVCGNGIVEPGEECETPNTDTCDATCNYKDLSCVEAKDLGILTGSISGGNAQVVNDAFQSYEISLAVYEKYDETYKNQVLFDSDTKIVSAGDSSSFSVDLPDCNYQIDLVCGEVLESLDCDIADPCRYDHKKIDWEHNNDHGYCGAPKEFTLIAHKIVCEEESDLPNWGDGGPEISSTTAEDYVDSHPGCDFEQGWDFQYAPQSASNPGDNTGESSSWTTFGPTDSSGMTSTTVSDMNSLWVREVWENEYLSFSGVGGSDISAEFYCYIDTLNYDNYDKITNTENGGMYYCIGFNVLEEEPYCGDGIINQPSEECDPPSGSSTQCGGFSCLSDCTCEEEPDPYCGDGIVNQPSEECDDNNNQDGDGCSSICLVECENEVLISFNDLLAGTVVDDEYSAYMTVAAENNKAGHPDKAIIFDSDNPTGGDPDLGTPNQDFGGPGIGEGGESGEPGQNDQYLHNVLIIAEDDIDNDNDGLVDDPDDESRGGKLYFNFNQDVDVETLKILDIEDNNGHVKVYDSSDNIIDTVNLQNLGDNSLQDIIVNSDDVRKMTIKFAGSGAVDDIKICADPEEPVCGDGIVEGSEECDDNNNQDGDGCSSECIVEYCGDSIVQAGLGEECDPPTYPGASSQCGGFSCLSDCTCEEGCPDMDISYADADLDQNNSLNAEWTVGTNDCDTTTEMYIFVVDDNSEVIGQWNGTASLEEASIDLSGEVPISFPLSVLYYLYCEDYTECVIGVGEEPYYTTQISNNAVPEFSTIGIVLTVLIAGLGIALIIKKRT
ncbi:DUF4215 domain-containing protein [Candidatus Woesearchaeota archaeon]|nr:DUF4215 domain-containing protein [Candidatus Woesearchaeota archaeon]